MTIKIDKDMPVPGLGAKSTKWPFGLMIVGDSFFTADADVVTAASGGVNVTTRNSPSAKLKRVV